MLNATKKKRLCLQCQACCKLVYIPTNAMSQKDLSFYFARGIKFIRVKGTPCAAVPSICPQLTKQGCKIYDSRPEDCRDYNGLEDPILKDICLWKVENQGTLKKGTPHVHTQR